MSRNRRDGCRSRRRGGCGKSEQRAALEFAREVAGRCKTQLDRGLVTLDDVVEAMTGYGHTTRSLGHAAGAVFRVGGFERSGYVVRSKRPGSGGRFLIVWRRVGKNKRHKVRFRRKVGRRGARNGTGIALGVLEQWNGRA